MSGFQHVRWGGLGPGYAVVTAAPFLTLPVLYLAENENPETAIAYKLPRQGLGVRIVVEYRGPVRRNILIGNDAVRSRHAPMSRRVILRRAPVLLRASPQTSRANSRRLPRPLLAPAPRTRSRARVARGGRRELGCKRLACARRGAQRGRERVKRKRSEAALAASVRALKRSWPAYQRRLRRRGRTARSRRCSACPSPRAAQAPSATSNRRCAWPP